MQPAPEPMYEGGARSPTKPTNPYNVVSISQKRHFEQQKCKGFLHRVCEAFFGGFTEKNAKAAALAIFRPETPAFAAKEGPKKGAAAAQTIKKGR